jgi:hypothetical protein
MFVKSLAKFLLKLLRVKDMKKFDRMARNSKVYIDSQQELKLLERKEQNNDKKAA